MLLEHRLKSEIDALAVSEIFDTLPYHTGTSPRNCCCFRCRGEVSAISTRLRCVACFSKIFMESKKDYPSR